MFASAVSEVASLGAAPHTVLFSVMNDCYNSPTGDGIPPELYPTAARLMMPVERACYVARHCGRRFSESPRFRSSLQTSDRRRYWSTAMFSFHEKVMPRAVRGACRARHENARSHRGGPELSRHAGHRASARRGHHGTARRLCRRFAFAPPFPLVLAGVRALYGRLFLAAWSLPRLASASTSSCCMPCGNSTP